MPPWKGWLSPEQYGPATSAMLENPTGLAVDKYGNLYIADRDEHRVRMVTPGGTISTLAGNGCTLYQGDNQAANINSELNMPMSVAIDPTKGDLYIADYGHNAIRKMAAINGVVSGSSIITTAVSSSYVYAPTGVAADASGNIYIADTGDQRIFRLLAGNLHQVAGINGAAGYSGDQGQAQLAKLNNPMGVAVDSAGNLYIADTDNQVIREVPNPTSSAALIYTVAGNHTAGFSGDGGLAIFAQFGLTGHTGVYGIALDSSNNLYLADGNNNRIRAVGAFTLVSPACTPNPAGYEQGATCTVAISGTNPTGSVTWQIDGVTLQSNTPLVGNSGSFPVPTTESYGTHTVTAIYSGDSTHHGGAGNTALVILTAQTISFTAPSSPVTYGASPVALVATGGASGNPVVFSIASGPGTISGSTLTITGPGSVVVAANQAGNATYAAAVQVTQTVVVNFALPTHGIITTIAGNGTAGYTGDGSAAASAELNAPWGVSVDPTGNVYIADANNVAIRAMASSTGNIFTMAASGLGGDGVAADPSGNFFIANTGSNRVLVGIPSSTGTYNIYVWAGNASGTAGYSGDAGTAPNALLHGPQGVAVDSSDNVYIADTINNRVRKVTNSTDIISTIAGNGTTGYTGDGTAATGAELNNPYGVALDASGNVYIADTYNNRIRKLTLSTGTISTVAGNGTAGYTGDGGSATSAELYLPTGVAVDSAGNIYIADYGNNRVRKVTTAGIISTVAGNGTGGYLGDNGSATSAELNRPSGVAVDTNGNIYIADSSNNRIRVIGH